MCCQLRVFGTAFNLISASRLIAQMAARALRAHKALGVATVATGCALFASFCTAPAQTAKSSRSQPQQTRAGTMHSTVASHNDLPAIYTDVLVVGGGIMGTSIAMFLSQPTDSVGCFPPARGEAVASVTLLERATIASEASALSAGTLWNAGWGDKTLLTPLLSAGSFHIYRGSCRARTCTDL